MLRSSSPLLTAWLAWPARYCLAALSEKAPYYVQSHSVVVFRMDSCIFQTGTPDGSGVRIKCILVAKDVGSVNLDAAIQFALEIGKIQSKSEVDISKSTAGIDAFLLRNTQGATIVSISKRVLKEKSENAAVAKAKDEFNAQNP